MQMSIFSEQGRDLIVKNDAINGHSFALTRLTHDENSFVYFRRICRARRELEMSLKICGSIKELVMVTFTSSSARFNTHLDFDTPRVRRLTF